MASYVANEKSKACVLIFPKDRLFIGGSSPSIGHEGEIKTEFIWAAPAQAEAHAGISLTFPILQSDGIVAIRSRSAGQIRNVVNIKLKFFADQLDLQTKECVERPSEYRQYVPDKHQKDTAWTAIKITGRPAIDGSPLPFAADEKFTGILHRGQPIKGSISLSSLYYGTTEFTCLVKVGNWSKVSSIAVAVPPVYSARARVRLCARVCLPAGTLFAGGLRRDYKLNTDGLFVIGDIETVKPENAKKKTIVVTNDDGEVEMIDLGPFSRLLQWFTREKRVGLPYDDEWQQVKPAQKG
ncbi:hypothetical protein K4K49_002675 [Colletotrichum sp. SAR 10_70]|nr:hypothetical protein K4K50_001144 [Colletotrichum sp. SAR 10_71]KAI8175117.1 hypothetical protein K4K49_002675 [Colletotrichum sp. SAR 10_70]KAI8192685.1 hypothetical protein K4K51_000171 [Colletotrichum sp. SAR 10_75]KAI8208371.1 hypothetical protein K4K52_001483 [Colletotrichum sp. SAR 10_76]KAI8230633.1 hypothetical protein K4K54_000563 [Colletotrichum sp. SAR 10_86]KAI8251469.1 hypothetical protein K4K53_012096 [Colletotrichum sp. SAR 10_77]